MSAHPRHRSATVSTGIGWRQPHYRELLERRPALGFLEVHSENFFADGGAALAVLEQARAHYPVSLHGVGLSLGSVDGVDPWHLAQLERLVQRIDPVRVSDHASFARGRWQGGTHHAADLLPLPLSREALDVLCANVQQVQDRLQRPLLVENLSAYLRWHTAPEDAPLTEPHFLTELARRTGCALLVDVNNLYVNARNAELAGAPGNPRALARAWLDEIPASVVGEIHLAGHTLVRDAQGEIAVDDHGSRVCDAVWQLYRHALARFGTVPTLIEWDTDLPALDVLLDEAAHAQRMTDEAAAAAGPMSTRLAA